MDRDVKKLLKNIDKMLSKVLEENKDDITKQLDKKLERALKEKTTISMKKDNEGKADMHIEGDRIALIVTLAGLEKNMLKQLDVSEEMFELIKKMVGTKEVN